MKHGLWLSMGMWVGACCLGQTSEDAGKTSVVIRPGPNQGRPSVPMDAAPIELQRLLHHVPDPEAGASLSQDALRDGMKEDRDYYQRVMERVASIRRPVQVRLTLEEALTLALEHSYALDAASFNPAIEATRVTEAQAAFDATLYSNLTKLVQDRPVASTLQATDLDRLSWETGVRKLLPSGMQVTAEYAMNRTFTTLQFQQINPEYFSQVNVGFRQPLLRGFGLDFNRAAIRVNKNNKHLSDLQFHREVQDLLREVEVAYWRLVQARRDVVISARLLEEFEAIFRYLTARKDFDVTKIQIEDTRANLETSRAEFLRVVANVENAEEQLLTLLNDPKLNLADDLEILPQDLPVYAPIVVDRVGELQTALENRQEIEEAKLAIANAQIGLGQAKNQTLPRLDLSFTYSIDGLGGNADQSFDEMTRHNFTEYLIGVELEIPLGNRAARSLYRRARLSLAQAEANLRRQIETVLLEVSVGVRELNTLHAQISPRFESVEAGERQVEAIVARAERKDFTQLNAELGARRNLATARRQLLQAMVDYNTAIIDLERSKGTLLGYNNGVIDAGEE